MMQDDVGVNRLTVHFSFPFFAREIQILDGMAIEFGCTVLDYSVMAMNSHVFPIVRNGERDGSTMKVLSAFTGYLMG